LKVFNVLFIDYRRISECNNQRVCKRSEHLRSKIRTLDVSKTSRFTSKFKTSSLFLHLNRYVRKYYTRMIGTVHW